MSATTVFDSNTIVVVDKAYFNKLESEFARLLAENERLHKMEIEFNALTITHGATFSELDELKWTTDKEINRLNSEICAITEERDYYCSEVDEIKLTTDKEINRLGSEICAITEERDRYCSEVDELQLKLKNITNERNESLSKLDDFMALCAILLLVILYYICSSMYP